MTIDTTVVYALLYMSLYFEVFLLISFIAHKKSTKTQSLLNGHYNDIDLPTVTITVPCYNEEKTLAKTLDSLLALDYPRDKLQVAIVNDGSVDKTSTIAHHFANKYAQITAWDKENGGKASAMNLALTKSNSELVGCLDADSLVSPDALRLIAYRFIESEDVSAVTPAIMIHDPQNVLQLMQRAEYMVGVFMRRVFSMMDSIIVTPGPFSIFRRSCILELSADHNEAWQHAHGTEDFEMGLRMQSNFKKIANEPMAHVQTFCPNTVYSLYRQRLRWVYGFLMNARDYKHMIGNIKYGNVGIFVLPTAILSVFGAVYMFGLFLFNLGQSAVDLAIRVYTAGLTLTWPSFELFYLNTNAMLFIVVALIGMVLVILHNSSAMSATKVYKRDTALYLALYGLLAPLWLTGALARAVVRAESKWKVIR